MRLPKESCRSPAGFAVLNSEIENSFLFRLSGLDLAAVDRFAKSLCTTLGPGVTFGLIGTLGAGKTRLTQSICGSLGLDVDEVTSPTFTLMQSHAGHMPAIAGRPETPLVLHHLDAYRVADEDEFLELGVDELFEQADAWTVIEWADRVESVMPKNTVWIRLEIAADPSLRVAEVYCRDTRLTELLCEVGRVVGESDSIVLSRVADGTV